MDMLSYDDASSKSSNKRFKFNCPRCNYGTDFKGNLILHLKSKKECIIEENNKLKNNITRDAILDTLKPAEPKLPQIECPQCNKTVGKANFARHLKTCKERSNDTKTIELNFEEIVKQQAERIEILTKQIKHLESCQIKVVFTINASNDTQEQPNKKYKKKNISHTVRVKCWNVHVGELVPKTKCMCCYNIDITQHNFHCGHIVAECNGGTYKINNLLPICNVCNSSMGSMNMNDFKSMYGFIEN